jgi:L-2-hydroxyglutarate oxidase LhgO
MEMIIMELSVVLLLAAIILMFRRQRAAAKMRETGQLNRLDEVARNSDLTKQTCVSALENLHNSLASLEHRTSTAERKLGSLMEALAVERKEHYQAAALLLAAGQDAARVAGLLDLPLAQVEMVRELKTILLTEGQTAAKAAPQRPAKAPKKKSPARSPKPRVRPILLTDVVETESTVQGRLSDRPAAFDGAAA